MEATAGESAGQYKRLNTQPENPFASLIPDQSIAIIPSFTLESGVTLHNVPVAYSTRGKLSPNRNNAMIICHALTGSADVSDWWGPLMGGQGRAFDVTRFFVVCMNSLGSPYGSASPVTNKDGDPSQGRYGPEFPLTTIRDDVNIHKLLLDDLGVRQIAAVVGGSMGGMLVLEYAYFGKEYVRAIVPIATSSRHSAWGISWGEAQRQTIYCDPKYDDGYYSLCDKPPSAGLGGARMSALLTYRSRNSFESRFGRNTPDPSRRQNINDNRSPITPPNEHWAVHNEGHQGARSPRPSSINGNPSSTPSTLSIENSSQPIPSATTTTSNYTDPQFHGATAQSPPTASTITTQQGSATSTIQLLERKRAPTYFSAQSYLRYQGSKFVKRFDSNCYIAITRKLDTHDISRHHHSPTTTSPATTSTNGDAETTSISTALSSIGQPALVIGIESDGLFTYAEQEELAANIPNARLRTIDSPEGHDAFLLQFEQVNAYLLEFFRDVLPDIMGAEGIVVPEETRAAGQEDGADGVGKMTKSSTFGEAEVEDITAW
ncbi:MAG: homoserine O- acetyltransferase [Pycnora praestabilis]|nr:MAG: homoserine O- acetyltransferase [Pycnora praestabilis]